MPYNRISRANPRERIETFSCYTFLLKRPGISRANPRERIETIKVSNICLTLKCISRANPRERIETGQIRLHPSTVDVSPGLTPGSGLKHLKIAAF